MLVGGGDEEMMIPNEPPWIVEIDGTQFAAPESVLLLLKAVSEERDELEEENEVLWDALTKIRDACDDENDMFMLNVTWLETFLDTLFKAKE